MDHLLSMENFKNVEKKTVWNLRGLHIM